MASLGSSMYQNPNPEVRVSADSWKRVEVRVVDAPGDRWPNVRAKEGEIMRKAGRKAHLRRSRMQF